MPSIEITPALTPDEWAHGKVERPATRIVADNARLGVADDEGRVADVSGADELFALMALANHALPGSDPRKLTRELGDALCSACEDLLSNSQLFLNLLAHAESQGGVPAAEAEKKAVAAFERRCALLEQAGFTIRALAAPPSPAGDVS
jgi:hypothetical protein